MTEVEAAKARIRAEAERFIANGKQRAELVAIRNIGYYDQQTARGVVKAGVLPFHRDEAGRIHFYLMKPKAKEGQDYDTPPQFQICKGTREYQYKGEGGVWQWEECKPRNRKMKEGDKPEPLFVTAIREGIEEIGLQPDSIQRSFEWGRATYQGQKVERTHTLWLYVVEVAPDTPFLGPVKGLADTGKQEWFMWPPEENKAHEVRADYITLLDEIAPLLSEALDRAPHKGHKKTATVE